MTVTYFSHDSNARNSEKLIKVRMKYGAEGYGVYFMMLERLREEQDYMSIKDYNVIAFDLRVDASEIKSIVEDFGLFVFTKDGKYFYSKGFNNRMALKDAKSKKRAEAGKKGAKNRWDKENNGNAIAKPSNDDSNAMAKPSEIDGKKRKEKKTKEKKTKDNNKKTSSPKRQKRVYDQENDYFKLAQFLFENILKNDPDAKEPNFQTWADDMRKLVELDHRDKHEVSVIIKWCQQDPFWSSNILSAAKLREQFPKLVLRKKNAGKFSNQRVVHKETLPDWAKDKPKNTSTKQPEKKVSEAEKKAIQAKLAQFRKSAPASEEG